MNLRIFILLLLLVGIYANSIAQTDSLKNDVFGGYIISPIEFPFINDRNLNNMLDELGFPNLNYPLASLGIGLQLYTNRWITNLSFNKATKSKTSDETSTEVEYSCTSINFGYDLTKKYMYSIYPYIGFKGYSLNYAFREEIPQATNIDNYFTTTLNYKEINHSRANLDFGLGASFQWFFLVNLRIGTLLPIEKSKWQTNNNQELLGDSPLVNNSFYLRVTIGLGNIMDMNEDKFNRL